MRPVCCGIGVAVYRGEVAACWQVLLYSMRPGQDFLAVDDKGGGWLAGDGDVVGTRLICVNCQPVAQAQLCELTASCTWSSVYGHLCKLIITNCSGSFV